MPDAPRVTRLSKKRGATLPRISVPAAEVIEWARHHCRVQYYGLYLQHNKLGWAKMGCRFVRVGGTHLLERVVQARMEARFYSRFIRIEIDWHQRWRTDGPLVALEYRQSSPQQEKKVTIVRHGAGLQMTQTYRSGSQPIPPVRKRLAAAPLDLAHSELAFLTRLVQGKIALGFGARYADFDPDRGKIYDAASILLGSARRTLRGVPLRLYKIQTLDLDRGLDSISLLDGDGAQLDGRIQGTIRIRREERAVALAPAKGQADFGLGAVVRAPMPGVVPRLVTRLRLRLSGYLPKGLEATPRQRLRRLGPRLGELTVERESLLGLPALRLPISNPRLSAELAPEPGIESTHPEIRALARKALSGERRALPAARRLTAFVFHYLRKHLSTNLDSALAISRAKMGDCTEHARLLVALCRAVGLPAREIAGLTWVPSLAGFGYHAWVEIWLGRWITADAAWNELPVNATHLQMARGTDQRWMGTLGDLRATVLEVRPSPPAARAQDGPRRPAPRGAQRQ